VPRLPRNCYPAVYLLLSNLSFSINGFGFLGRAALPWEIRCTVHNTINSELLFCKLLLRKKFPRIGMSPSPESCCKCRSPVIHQARDHKALAILQFEFSFGLRVLRAGW